MTRSRYLLYNPSGPAADALLADLPDDVAPVPFGWTAEIEAARNNLLASLFGVSGISSLPCILYLELAHDGVPEHWVEQRFVEQPAAAWSWDNIVLWHANPIMSGDRRTYDGKTWESLLDYNVWQPPVGWREIVSEGYPAWVQPTGAHDAYKLGDRVTYNGANWENTGSAANVWAPGVFGWTAL